VQRLTPDASSRSHAERRTWFDMSAGAETVSDGARGAGGGAFAGEDGLDEESLLEGDEGIAGVGGITGATGANDMVKKSIGNLPIAKLETEKA
jgi:hypothetical protein